MALTPSLPPDSPNQAWPQFSATCRSARKYAVETPSGPGSKSTVRKLWFEPHIFQMVGRTGKSVVDVDFSQL
jgi:hypothetical protein